MNVDVAATTEHFVLVEPGSLVRTSATLAMLRQDWVRVRFAYCGVCGTDVTHFTGGRPTAYPVSMGHEWVAVVETVGADVAEFERGDVVTSDLNFRCGSCLQCRRRRSHLCESGQQGLFTNRGFGVRADIHSSYLLRCSGPPTPRLALAEPLSCALHAGSWAAIDSADRVLVVGVGGIGMCMAFALMHAVSGVAFEIADIDPARVDRLLSVLGEGARAAASPIGCYDVVLDTSGSWSGLRAACDYVAPGGRLCTMSHLATDGADSFLLESLLHKDVTFTLSYLNGERSNLELAIALLERHWDDRWNNLLEVRPLSALTDAMANRSRSPWNKTIIDVGKRTESNAE